MPGFLPFSIRISIFTLILIFPLCDSFALSRLRLRIELSSLKQTRLEVNLKRISREVSLRRSTLVVERANDGSDFAVLAKFHSPSGRPAIIDQLSGPGLYSYRAKLILARKRNHKHPPVLKSSIVHFSIIEETSPPPPIDNADTAIPPLVWPELDANQSECPADHAALALERINYYRALNGLGALQPLQVLEVSARLHAIKMARAQQLTHEGWFQIIWDLGFRGPHMSQNIANYIFSPYAVVDALMTSAGHKTNILNTRDQHIGIGCLIDQNGKIWWAHNFGS